MIGTLVGLAVLVLALVWLPAFLGRVDRGEWP